MQLSLRLGRRIKVEGESPAQRTLGGKKMAEEKKPQEEEA